MKSFSAPPLLTLLVILLIGVGFLMAFRPSLRVSEDTRPMVAVTIFPLYDIVRNVAGDDVQTVLMLPAGAEPHSFDPTPSVVRDVQSAAVVYAIGHGLDSWTEDLTDGSKTPTVVVDRGVRVRASEEGGGSDPHYWLDVQNAIRITETVREDLAMRFPEHADAFRLRAEAYTNSLAALDARIHDLAEETPNRKLITFHDAWYYFADTYGFTIVGTFEPAPGREPTPRDLSTLLAELKSADLHTMYTEPLFSSAAIDAFVADNDLSTYAIDDIGGTTPETDSYLKLMEHNAETLRKNR